LNNELQYLFEEIGQLKNLKTLDLNVNQLQWLPIEILELNELEQLWLYNAFDLNNLNQEPEILFKILQKLEEKNVLNNESPKYLKKEVYPVLKRKIEEKYKINDLEKFKDNLNLDNLNF